MLWVLMDMGLEGRWLVGTDRAGLKSAAPSNTSPVFE